MPAVPFLDGAEIAFTFQSVQQGIQGSSTQPVTMASQLLDNPQPEDRLFRRMVKDVQSDQA
jgi:hypothetical protein